MESLLALTTLAIATAFTPGPNNVLLAHSGANFGLRRTVPHIAGVVLGFAVMNFCVAYFLGTLVQQSTLLREALRWGSAGLLLYLAWKIATSGGLSDAEGTPRPFRLLEAAAFQWVNPKAWAIVIAASGQFVVEAAPLNSALVVVGVFFVVGFSSSSTWAVAGQLLAGLLANERRLTLFNRTMGVLVGASAALLFT